MKNCVGQVELFDFFVTPTFNYRFFQLPHRFRAEVNLQKKSLILFKVERRNATPGAISTGGVTSSGGVTTCVPAPLPPLPPKKRKKGSTSSGVS